MEKRRNIFEVPFINLNRENCQFEPEERDRRKSGRGVVRKLNGKIFRSENSF
jgi:hypothetical protein